MLLDKEGMLKTSADDLYDLVKNKGKLSVEEAAKILKIPQPTVQSLIDFLVEEKIFGLEYKFTTPYVYLNVEEIDKKLHKGLKKEDFQKLIVTKAEFYQKAKKKNIDEARVSGLWKKYIRENLQYIKDEFYGKAKLRHIPDKEADDLWNKFQSYLS